MVCSTPSSEHPLIATAWPRSNMIKVPGAVQVLAPSDSGVLKAVVLLQDEGPELPPDLSADMTDFLQICFQKEPHRRPSARALLKHRWITYNRQTLRSSWSRTQGMKSRGQKTDAHVSVSTVVERILQASRPCLEQRGRTASPCCPQTCTCMDQPIESDRPRDTALIGSCKLFVSAEDAPK